MTSDQNWDDPQAPSDAELIKDCRAGDSEAAGLLFERHHDAALTYARKLAGSSRADDIAAEAFTRTLALLGDGKGPDAAFRPYLISAVHNTFVSMIRSDDRYVLVDDPGEFEREFGDDEAPFTGLVAEAFHELPERWQVVLWHTLIEGDSLEVTAQHLGVTAAAVGSLTYRARRGLSNVLMAKLAVEGDECMPTRELLRLDPDELSRTQRNAVNRHLDDCDPCNRLAAVVPAAAKSGIAGILVGGLVAGGGGAYLALRQPAVAAAAAATGLPPRPPTSRAWIAAPVAGVLILVLLAVLLGRTDPPTTAPDVSGQGQGGAAPTAPPGTASAAPPQPPPKPPTSAPPKPPTSAPPTSAPPTSAPPTSAPPTSAPPTSAPPTSAPPTSRPPTSAPPTSRPPTSAPPTSRPPTSAPPTSRPPTSAPPTSAPPTTAPPTTAPPTSAPPTSAPPTSAPPTSAPPSTPPPSPPPPSPSPTPSSSGPGVVRPSLGFVRAEYSNPEPGVHRLDVYVTGGTPSSVVTMQFEGHSSVWVMPGVRKQNALCLPAEESSVECRLLSPTRDDVPLTVYVRVPEDEELVGRMTISEPGNADKDPANNELVWTE